MKGQTKGGIGKMVSRINTDLPQLMLVDDDHAIQTVLNR